MDYLCLVSHHLYELHRRFIPGVIGLLLVTSPRLFTKAEGEKFEKAKKTLKTIGFVLIGVAVIYSITKMLEHS